MQPLRALLPYCRRYRGIIGVGLILVVVSNAFTLLAPHFLGRGVDALAGGEPLRYVLLAAGAMICVTILGGLARFGMRVTLNGASRYVETDLRQDLYRHLLSLSPEFYQRTPTGHLIALSTNDLLAVRMVAGPAIMYLTDTLTRTLIALPLMIGISGRLTLAALAPLSLLPVVMIRFGRSIHRHTTSVQEQFATMTTHAHENLSGVRVVRAYLMETRERDRWGALNSEYIQRSLSLARVQAVFYPMINLLGGLGAVAVLWYGSILVISGAVTLGGYIAFGAYVVALFWPMIALGWVTNLFQRGAASMGRINEVLQTQSAVRNPATPRPLAPAPAGRSLEFDGVWFRYPSPREGERGWALRDISFRVGAGRSVAIVGATGAGKSALVDLIPRLFLPQRGAIRLDGVDIRDLPLGELRAALGVVPQEAFLFSDTLARNIVFEDPTADRMEWAAVTAQLDQTVRAFPDGYDTLLGERGINLSGGQKQRATLARALARDPSVLILDDALSAVDTQTEARILRGLRAALAGRTSLIVSHRISAVRHADWIIVLDDGQIVEQGLHSDLFQAEGKYWELLRRQELEESLERDGVSQPPLEPLQEELGSEALEPAGEDGEVPGHQ